MEIVSVGMHENNTKEMGQHAQARERNKAMRLYINLEQPETIMENLMNRTSRPYKEWKKMVIPALQNMGFTDEDLDGIQIKWSQKAGCTMCPCSPGFIIQGRTMKTTGTVAWVKLKE